MNAQNEMTDFRADVIERSRSTPVLVDFWAPWCGPCKMLGPVLERLADEANGRWTLVKINTDEHPELAERFAIRGIPDVRLFHRGEVIAQFAGAQPEAQVRRWLEENLPTPKREAMAQAREHLRAGRSREAVALLRPLAESHPEDSELVALTARALVFSEPRNAATLIERLPANHPWEEAAAVVRELSRLFALADQGETSLSPSPSRAHYLAGIAALRREDFETALGELIAALEIDPHYDGDHARAAVLAIFKHLGLRHPISEKFSRAFSMAVNV